MFAALSPNIKNINAVEMNENINQSMHYSENDIGNISIVSNERPDNIGLNETDVVALGLNETFVRRIDTEDRDLNEIDPHADDMSRWVNENRDLRQRLLDSRRMLNEIDESSAPVGNACCGFSSCTIF